MNYEKGQLSRCADTYHYHMILQKEVQTEHIFKPHCIRAAYRKKTTDKPMTELFSSF